MLRNFMRNHARALLLGSALTVSAAGIGVVAAQEATPEATPDVQTTPMPPMGEAAQRPFLGISITDGDNGVLINEVLPGSPAAAAELQAGDVITAINGTPLADAAALRDAISALEIGAALTLDVTRGDESLTLEATLGAMESMTYEFTIPMNPGDMRPDGGRPGRGDGPFSEMRPFMMQIGGNGRLGVTFITLDEQVAAERGSDLTDGALVVEVVEGSPAAIAGLQADDVITAVNSEPVDAERTLRDRLIAYEPDDVVTLTVVRAGETLSLEVTLGQPEMMDGMPFFDGRMPGMPNGMPFRFDFIPPHDMMPEGMPEATVAPNA
jgi:S1-C subfamily serine protease